MRDPRNPYVAPRAPVADAPEEFQPVRVLSVSGRIGRGRYILYTMALPLVLMFCIGLLAALLGEAGMALIIAGWGAVVGVAAGLAIQSRHALDMRGWARLL